MPTTTSLRPPRDDVAVSPDALAELRAEFATYRRETDARIAALERAQSSDASRLMATLLAAIDAAWGRDAFLAEHLCEADANLRFLLNGRSPRAVGKLLARHAGRTFDGRRLVDAGRADGRRLWRVEPA